MESSDIPKEIIELLSSLGFTLDKEQIHIGGERFLMMREKMVLTGEFRGKKVVVKISKHIDGQKEIEHEKRARDLLQSLVFARDNILFPEEIYFGNNKGHLIWATEFIAQEKVYVAHDIEEQFFLALRAFEEQEAFHATTFEHLKTIDKFFPVFTARKYFEEFSGFKENIKTLKNKALNKTISRAEDILTSNKKVLDSFSNYLTHTDFVPHNFRVKDKTIYMLDLSAVHFGNKYEGWARFLNYMIIHNPELEKLLLEYIQINRPAKEMISLKLMRIYKAVVLLDYYARSLPKTKSKLKKLTYIRIDFWHKVLTHLLEDEPLPTKLVDEYKKERDLLRSKEEKRRQREFAVA